MIEAILAKARTLTGEQPFRYRFSTAGDPCLRALVYDAQDADDGTPPSRRPRRLRDVLAIACGNAVGEVLERAADGLGYATQHYHQFDTGAVRVSGHSDVTDRRSIVWDIKLVGEKSWKRAPHPKHILQANGYAVSGDLPRWGLLYVRGSTIFDDFSDEAEIRPFDGPADVGLAQELCGTWESVDAHRKLRTLPERVFNAHPKKWPCAWCRHLERCAPQEET